MKTVIIYDSFFGNTKKIAYTIAEVIQGYTVDVCKVTYADIEEAELIIIGSPTRGGRPTKNIYNLLSKLSVSTLRNKYISAFDTRFASRGYGLGFNILNDVIGFAAPRIATRLQMCGGKIITPPIGFSVENKSGPLFSGELDRAKKWAKSIDIAYKKIRENMPCTLDPIVQ